MYQVFVLRVATTAAKSMLTMVVADIADCSEIRPDSAKVYKRKQMLVSDEKRSLAVALVVVAHVERGVREESSSFCQFCAATHSSGIIIRGNRGVERTTGLRVLLRISSIRKAREADGGEGQGQAASVRQELLDLRDSISLGSFHL